MSSKNSNGNTYGKGRTRNFACVVYPESAPADWQDILAGEFIPCFISPLHDQDLDPDGEPKKAHYHVLLCFDSVKTVEQALDVTTKIGGVGLEKIVSLRGYARYLCHLDNPEKHQYDTALVRSLYGADYSVTIGLATDKYKAIKEMMAFCSENSIYCYADLLEMASEDHYDWFRILCDNGTVVMKEYLKSKTWKADLERQK